MAAGGWVLETATRVTLPGGRPARAVAASIRARISASLAAMSGTMRRRIGRRRGGASIPARWLLTDPARLPDPRPLLAALPRGAAVLLRGATPGVAREVARDARARGLLLLVGGEGRAALALRAGLHLPDRGRCRHLLPFLRGRRGRLLSLAVHGRAGVARARRLRADVALVSPAFATASHPGAPALGPLRWAALARALPCPAIALGGMDARAARRLPRRFCAGWAAIGAWAARLCGGGATLSQRSRVGAGTPVAGASSGGA